MSRYHGYFNEEDSDSDTPDRSDAFSSYVNLTLPRSDVADLGSIAQTVDCISAAVVTEVEWTFENGKKIIDFDEKAPILDIAIY